MSGIPPLPPLRMKEADGSPNVIPVFQVTVSNMTLINNGGGKVTLDGAGGTGPAGPAGTVTIGSGITGGATDGFLLMVSNGATLGQIDSSSFQRAIAFPITTGSGGTGRATIGSAHTILGVNSSEASLTYYAILASDNTTIVKSGTGIFISANTGAGGGSGVVQIGSTHHLAFYPALGTTVSGSLIRVNTGSGVANFNLSVLTSTAANSANGDVWFQSSSNNVYLFLRSNNLNYSVQMTT